MEGIRIWLNGKRDFEAGAKLYSLYGCDALLKKLFAERPVTKYKQQTLEESLLKLLSKNIEVKATPVIPGPTVVERAKQESNPDFGWSKSMDKVEAAMHAKWRPLFLEMMDRCSRMEDIAMAGKKDPMKKKESCLNVLRILKLEKLCDQLYEERDCYKRDGTMPVNNEDEDLCMDPQLMPLKLENARRRVRDNKNKLAKDPNNLNAATLLKKWEKVVDYYKKELNLV